MHAADTARSAARAEKGRTAKTTYAPVHRYLLVSAVTKMNLSAVSGQTVSRSQYL